MDFCIVYRGTTNYQNGPKKTKKKLREKSRNQSPLQ